MLTAWAPEGGLTFQEKIDRWESVWLTPEKRYKGPDVRYLGFSYNFGEYIPVDRRYSAMLEHNWAIACHTGN